MAKSSRRQKLKVFRTPIGFHDAYVAAPSQQAALEAWGTDVNLFARGSAEQVTDPELTKEPLANPGVVFKRLRGTESEQVQELGKAPANKLRAKGRRDRAAKAETAQGQGSKPKPPKPSRSDVAEAEKALDEIDKEQRKELQELRRKEQDLARERRELERAHRRDRQQVEKRLGRAREEFDRATEKWKSASR